MILNPASMKPIYVQIAAWLEGEILNGHLPGDERVYSQYQLAEMFNVNPATAAKGLNLLADEEIVYKQRGLGMYVARDAQARILAKRKGRFVSGLVREVVSEAGRLGMGTEELISLIRKIGREDSEDMTEERGPEKEREDNNHESP
ncbi:GntR family transcriptional regulator [Acididesulfobacillus acetoxydans]|nr:GntR family transcriptional regulator [Acididesulfobacillus acetoxydans]